MQIYWARFIIFLLSGAIYDCYNEDMSYDLKEY